MPKEKKTLQNDELDQFTDKEIKAFKEYNESITTFDPTYSELKPRNRKVLVRVFTKDFSKKTKGLLAHSKTEFLPIKSGVNDEIIYDDFPNPYPFTRKAIVIASLISDLAPGDVISMVGKPTVGIGKQDSGFVQVQNAFIHPDHEEDYHEYPQDPKDPNYGYLLINEQHIELNF